MSIGKIQNEKDLERFIDRQNHKPNHVSSKIASLQAKVAEHTTEITALISGTVVDATNLVKGKIKLAGDLGGTSDAPTVPGLAGKADSATVTASLALKQDAATAATDAELAAGLAANATADRARANHTGTQLASTVSDFNTQVRTNRIDQMAAPTGEVNMGGQIVGSVDDAVDPDHGTNLGQLLALTEAISAGLTSKGVCSFALPGTIAATGGTLTGDHILDYNSTTLIDGVAVQAGDRVLVPFETGANRKYNTIWTVDIVGGGQFSMSRPVSPNAIIPNEAYPLGSLVSIKDGLTMGGRSFFATEWTAPTTGFAWTGAVVEWSQWGGFPLGHAVTHAVGGSDPISELEILATYRTILQAGAGATGLASVTATRTPFTSDGLVAAGRAPQLIYLDPADFAITGKTTKLRVRAQFGANATSPAITATIGLSPVTAFAGGAGVLTVTLGTLVSGSTVAEALTANERSQGNSGDFDIPAAGWYALTVAGSGTQAANSYISLNAQLRVRHV